MNNDLISREALKEHKFLTPQVKIIGGRRCGKTREQIIEAYQKGWNDCIDAIIDNAPTARCSDSCDIETQLLGAELHGIKSGYEEAQKKFMRPQGKWIVTAEDNDGVHRICCPLCSYEKGSNSIDPIVVTFTKFPKFCENCGADMREETDNEQ